MHVCKSIYCYQFIIKIGVERLKNLYVKIKVLRSQRVMNICTQDTTRSNEVCTGEAKIVTVMHAESRTYNKTGDHAERMMKGTSHSYVHIHIYVE